ncbi:hypothetical protein FOL47_008720 [Perkinsus chesapeaki]|uniref:Reverse transcriptase domain-containing protein n=1 Tax=Perkinsus chesapeaki TaxID=330153 RepID=A0A7J6LC97_PERCH|nr:hypothetical protein FOL47_008720 [Perkinsus chesapeaki]
MDLPRLHAHLYADDSVILFRYKDEAGIQASVNEIFNRLEQWCLSVKCRLSRHKTKLMCFPAHRCHGGPEIEISIGGHLVKEGAVKWLGLQLDRKFKWGGHVACSLAKIEGAYHSVKRHVRSTWGLLPDVAVRLFDIIARGYLLHGVAYWGVAALRGRIANQIRSLQAKMYKRACRISARAPTAFSCRLGLGGIAWDDLCSVQCAKRRVQWPEFFRLGAVKHITNEIVGCHLVERLVDSRSQGTPSGMGPVALSSRPEDIAELYPDGSVKPGISAGVGAAWFTPSGTWSQTAGAHHFPSSRGSGHCACGPGRSAYA